MKVVLAKTIETLGIIGETKEVKPGFARNYLFARKLAVLPTDARAKAYRAARAAARTELLKGRALVTELAEKWRGQTVTVKARASEDGVLYGSVGAKEVMKALGRDDIQVQMSALKAVGSHKIELQLPHGLTVPITVIVQSDDLKA